MALPLPGTPLIIDIGGAYVKIGFAGEPDPRYIFPCITGTEKYKSVMVDAAHRSVYVGNDAMKMRGVLKVKHPVQRGAIMDWDEYYEILNYIIYTLLRIENPSHYPVIYIEHPFVHRETREFIARIFFETHKFKSFIMLQSPFLSLFSVGLTTGFVVESGDGVTWIVPIVNGRVNHQAIQKLNLAGTDVNHNLKSLMLREGINIESSAADEILREIKKKNCYFVLDPNNPTVSNDTYSYPMPDGSVKNIPNRVLHEAPEVMFKPTMLGYNIMNIPQAIIYSIQLIDKVHWDELLGHIVLSGGNLSYSGFEERLRLELNALLPQLGKVPGHKKDSSTFIEEDHKLKKLESEEKKKDTCPKCGTSIDLSDRKKECPSCGASLELPKLSIDLGGSPERPSRCPYCNKDIKDNLSTFCPFCGNSLVVVEIPTIPQKINTASAAKEFTDVSVSDEIIRFFVPENLQNAVYNGASVIGSLPSFQNFFITSEEFNADANILYRDISDIFK